MSSTVFQHQPFVERSLFQKIFRQHPTENAVVALNNLLASKPVRQIIQQDVNNIEQQYMVSLEKEFTLNMEEFYATHLHHCFADKTLDQDELDDLKMLKSLLSLSDVTVDKLHLMIGEVVFRKSFQEAVADGRLTASETDFLTRLENELKLPKELVDKISAETRTAYLEQYVARITSDERLSPDEEKELLAVASSLNIDVSFNEQTKERLRKMKLYWALENLDLPVIETGISLQRSEYCHFQKHHVKWYELRVIRTRVRSSGYTSSYRVCKGFYLRSGNMSYRSQSTEGMTLIDEGSLYLTNKRIVFMGNKKNTNIRLEKILDIKPYTDGVEIEKDTGKSPIIQIDTQADIFCMMLERILSER